MQIVILIKIIKPPLALNAYLDLNNTVRTLGEALVWMSFTVQEATVLIKKIGGQNATF